MAPLKLSDVAAGFLDALAWAEALLEAIELDLDDVRAEREQRDARRAGHERGLLDGVGQGRRPGHDPAAALSAAREPRERAAGVEGVHAREPEVEQHELGPVPLGEAHAH